jgi:hypothetical protein
LVIDLAGCHIRERTNIEIETVEVVESVWVRGAMRRRGRRRWSVRHGYGCGCGLSSILNCIGRGPTRAIPAAFGVAEVGSVLGSVDATAIAVGAGDRSSNWLEMTM